VTTQNFSGSEIRIRRTSRRARPHITEKEVKLL
jgi:hypothetical protein